MHSTRINTLSMIASVGDLSVDNYVRTGEKHLGGIATNFAIQIRRLGEEVQLYTAVGSDRDGSLALDQLKSEGISTEHVASLEGKTSEQRIRLNGNERTFFGFISGVLSDWQLTDKDIESMRDADAIAVPLTDGLKHVFERIYNTEFEQTLKMADFSRDADIRGFATGDVAAMLQHYIENIDIAFIGGDEEILESVEAIAGAFPHKIIILTLGAQGSIAFHKGKQFKQSARWIKNLVDTTGCGDAFRAAFTVHYLKTKDIATALEEGSMLASKTATHFGAC